MSSSLESLAKGFRTRYLRWDEIVAQLEAWAHAFPNVVRVRSIGESPEGRPLLLATIGPDPDRERPAVWVDGNIHATELCGSSVALAIAEDALRLHLEPNVALHGLSEASRTRLRDVLFHVLPRMSPDGAECVLREGRYVRSIPRDARPNRQHARWISQDVDGDGVALSMRKKDEGGEFVETKNEPRVLVPRTIDDEGPFYKIYPEGVIEHFDGDHVPDPHFLSDNETDLNRNFPYMWMPEPEQVGAGAYPASEPETRAVVEFVTKHPTIFAWLNLHTFGGVFIRPLGHQSDKKMDENDRALFRQIEDWGEKIAGYPTVSGFEEFLYEPDKPLHGELSDFAYHQRGCIAYVCELWDLFHQLGMERKKPFVDHYTHFTRDDLLRLAKWDREHNAGRVLVPWKPFVHPQLGEVEVGGIDPRVGLSNPPYEKLGEVCEKQSSAFLRVASLAPNVVVASVEQKPLSGELRRVSITVENRGYLPTYVLASAKKLSWNEPLHVDVKTDGCALATPSEAHREIGHLDGWGRGLFDDTSSLFFQRSRGSTGRKTMHWVVSGHGVVTLRIGSCRTGFFTHRIDV